MSDKEESNLPSAAECDARSKQFAAVTRTDTALAMFYLQDKKWDLESAINAYFEGNPSSSDAARNTGTTTKTTSIRPVCVRPVRKPWHIVGFPTRRLIFRSTVTDDEPHRIRLMSWNIDGLDPKNLESRTKGVCETITKENPHVVFLQEVIQQSEDIISEKCPTYHFVPAAEESYYTAMMLRTEYVEVEDTVIMPFPTSIMGRNVLAVKCKIKGEKFYLMTSHLESTKDHAKERINQLKKAFGHMGNADPDRTVIFGGDLNLRDNEVAGVGGLPEGVLDLWEVTGKRAEARYTWDTARNDNLEWSHKFKPKCRFDRLYLKHPAETNIVKPVYFELIGIERLKSCQRFPSDHWGLLSHFNILSKVPK